VADLPSIGETKERANASLASLPPALRNLAPRTSYEVRMSDALRALRERTIAGISTTAR
jgi:hypothetical protein